MKNRRRVCLQRRRLRNIKKLLAVRHTTYTLHITYHTPHSSGVIYTLIPRAKTSPR